MKTSLFSIFDKNPKLITALSEKEEGSMKFSSGLSQNNVILENQKRFFSKLRINPQSVVRAGLIHGNKIRIVTKEETGKIIPETDGLLSEQVNLFLCLTVADCLPVFFFDEKRKIIGLVHAGWRGLVKGILGETVKRMTSKFGSQTKDILVGIGPGISVCHYEVKKDLFEKFKKISPDVFRKEKGKIFLDLKKTAYLQLLSLKIKPCNIEIHPDCTYCLSTKYFSYRREKPKEIKTMMAVIGKKL